MGLLTQLGGDWAAAGGDAVPEEVIGKESNASAGPASHQGSEHEQVEQTEQALMAPYFL